MEKIMMPSLSDAALREWSPVLYSPVQESEFSCSIKWIVLAIGHAGLNTKA